MAIRITEDGAVIYENEPNVNRELFPNLQGCCDSIRSDIDQLKENLTGLQELADTKATAIYETASGEIASFHDGADNIPMKDVLVHIEPVQAGSGDPSPDNVRPITGWTACVISHSGADMTNPTTYSITFPSEAGTVYGGTLDVSKGELVVDRSMIAVKNMDWSKTTSYAHSVFYVNLSGKARTYQKGACSFLRNISSESIKSASDFANYAENEDFALCNTNEQIFIRYDGITDVNTLKTQFADETFVFPINSPVTYQLTPQEITSLLGENNIWSDGGDISVEYPADTKSYIDNKIAEAIAAALA